MSQNNRYEYLDRLEGGMGYVDILKDHNLDRKVAIKTIQNPDELPRLRDEIDALLQLRSKHVVQVYDILYGADNQFGIVMEFISGFDLTEVAMFRNFDLIQRLKLLWQISSGIEDIHKAGLIHRDLKPNNMMIDSEGVVKIFDFGLSRNVGVNDQTIGFRGTYGFSAPEQFNEASVELTQSVDVYAFGVISLFILCNGILPRELKCVPPIPANYTFSELPELNAYTKLVELFERTLSHCVAARPTMSELKKEISRVLLHNRHQAVAIIRNETKFLNFQSPSANLSYSNIGSCEIRYDGFDFKIMNVKGEVFVNNKAISEDSIIPGSCVVAFGGSHRRADRAYVTFDVSNPEVYL